MNGFIVAIEEEFYDHKKYLGDTVAPRESAYVNTVKSIVHAEVFSREEVAERMADRVRDQFESIFEDHYEFSVYASEVEIQEV